MEENVYLAEYHAAKGHMEQIADLDKQLDEIYAQWNASKKK